MGQSWFSQYLLPGNVSRETLLEQNKQVVFACVSAISEAFAKIKLSTIRTTDGKEVYQHPVIKLLENPNPDYSKFQFLELHQAYKQLSGEVFWYLALGERTGLPQEIYIMRADYMSVVPDPESGLVQGYVLSANGKQIPLDKKEVLHFKGMPNPLDPLRGLGPVEAGGVYIQTEDFASRYTRNFLFNNAKPSGIISLSGKITPEEFEQLKKKWKDEYGTLDNAGKTAFVRNAQVEFTQFGQNMGDLALGELRRMLRDDIMMLFRVSKPILGITEDVNYANAKTAAYLFAKRIEPEMYRFIDHINSFLMPRYGRMYNNVKLVYENPVPENESEQADYYTRAVNSWMTVNEIRENEGLPPIENGDSIYMPINLAELGGIQEQKTVKKTLLVKKNKILDYTKDQKLAYWKSIYKLQRVYELKFKDLFIPLLEKQMASIIAEFRGKSLKAVEDYLLSDEINDEMAKKLNPLILELYALQGQAGMEFAGSSGKFELTQEVKNYISKRINRFATDFNSETRDFLAKSLIEGVQNGESKTNLVKRIKEVYKEAEAYRTERIARTETIKASNRAAIEGYKQTKYVTGKQWYANPGACELCKQLDGKIIKLEGNFADRGDKILNYTVDYEDVSEPTLHPNCFLHHSVKVTTDKGEKNINQIKTGDKVLTHKGRYKKVLNVFQSKERYDGEAVKIKFRGSNKETNVKSIMRNSVTVTPEHPFLTIDGWKMAKDITKQDKLFVIAKECSCGKMIPYWKDYCSMECQLTKSTRDKISQSKKGKGNWMFGRTGKLHHLWQGGRIWWRGKEWDTIKYKVRQRDNFTCQDCGISENEHILKWNQPLHVHHINPYRKSSDNSMENLITYCCKCHRKAEGSCMQSVLSTGGARFVEIEIKEVKFIKNFKGEKRYNLEVEDDHSYVAKGIVTHNCECTTLPIGKPLEELLVEE